MEDSRESGKPSGAVQSLGGFGKLCGAFGKVLDGLRAGIGEASCFCERSGDGSGGSGYVCISAFAQVESYAALERAVSVIQAHVPPAPAKTGIGHRHSRPTLAASGPAGS